MMFIFLRSVIFIFLSVDIYGNIFAHLFSNKNHFYSCSRDTKNYFCAVHQTHLIDKFGLLTKMVVYRWYRDCFRLITNQVEKTKEAEIIVFLIIKYNFVPRTFYYYKNIYILFKIYF